MDGLLIRPRESDLYHPVKRHLEALGYTVRGEVGKCDMVAVHDDTMIAVELKLSFCLSVLYQAVRRLPLADFVYIAVSVPGGRKARANWEGQVPDAVRLCRMLGLGLLSVQSDRIGVLADPAPYQPRKQPKLRARLLSEFNRRTGDHNLGGTNKCARVTAYREDALACANALAQGGSMKGKAVRDAAGVAKASNILRTDVYGWFVRLGRGMYDIAPAGRAALERYADVVASRPVTRFQNACG